MCEVLLRLRKRSGVSGKRLGGTEIDLEQLLRQPAVEAYAETVAISREQAALEVLPRLAQRLPPTTRLIVDVELRLRLLQSDPPAGIDLGALYAEDLGDRRAALCAQWQSLHAAVGAADSAGRTPSISTLRSVHERPAFRAFAELLAAGTLSFDGGLTVVGDAVMDHRYAVDEMLASGIAIWGDLKREPGGKGLNRALFGARLGMDTRLVCALGDDEEGRVVLEHLKLNGVDTRLVTTVPGIRTPVTAVIMPKGGEPGNIASKDDRLTLLARGHQQGSLRNALRQADVIVLTFEQLAQMVNWVLENVRDVERRPWVLVSAAPPLQEPGHLRTDMRGIDYLVGTPAELVRLADLPQPVDSVLDTTLIGAIIQGLGRAQRHSRTGATSPEPTPARAREVFLKIADHLVGNVPRTAIDEVDQVVVDEVAEALVNRVAPGLLGRGVQSVCAIRGGRCRAWSVRGDFAEADFTLVDPGAAVSSAPFVVALAYRLVASSTRAVPRPPAELDDFAWATAAMSVKHRHPDKGGRDLTGPQLIQAIDRATAQVEIVVRDVGDTTESGRPPPIDQGARQGPADSRADSSPSR
ncbi:carbohydrate kinase family protein [Nocardia sp. CDC160]|uniref:carbohydrate kinase family protein n=1 Tax=Nocardia sp. CDC160 TaxID=3112166 RepID=UPI002DBBED86|nr:carbohydrate kinase family protein [Nocardia sp. CDC160]MEC3917392.1 carbohydrate kinase family protein [Nocardia sp. CDC160]